MNFPPRLAVPCARPFFVGLLALGLAGAANAQCELTHSTAASAAPGDQFGFAVSFDGTRAVWGAPFEDGAGDFSGAAYVFDEGEGLWEQAARLSAADAATGHAFGTSLALDGDLCLVGAPSHSGAGTSAGAVYVFERIASAWVETDRLQPVELVGGENFGASLALEDGVAVIGAPKGAAGGGAGAAYVYALQGGTFVQVQKLVPAAPQSGSRFGAAVALANATIAVGAPNANAGGSNDAGSVHVFLDQAGWVEVQALDAGGDALDATHFGASVALDGEWLVVGAPEMIDGALIPGAAYAHRRDDMGTGDPFDDRYLQEIKLAPGPEDRSVREFGAALAFAAGRLLVGAPAGDQLVVPSGSVYVYALDAVWELEQRLQADDGEAGNGYGYALGGAGDRFAVGSRWSNLAGLDAGAGTIVRVNANGPFAGCPEAISTGAGGKQILALDGGPAAALLPYIVVGSASGTVPGIPLPGLLVPLNPDFYFQFSITHTNAPPLIDTFGFMGPDGTAGAQFNLAAGSAPAAFVGLELNHAFALLSPADLSLLFVSNPVAVRLGN